MQISNFKEGSILDPFIGSGTTLRVAKKMNDQFSDIEELIKIFISKLSLKFSGIPIYRYDERFSSKLAFKAMIDAGINKKNRRDKYIVDKISATIILQGYLKSKES